MNLNPDSLTPETEEEKVVRQSRTGVLGSGKHVTCAPFIEDPLIIRVQSRVVCLVRPYTACGSCPHRNFSLFFEEPSVRFSCVACPRWSVGSWWTDAHPDSYVSAELATCEAQPFQFCSVCPSKEDLAAIGLDKTQEGWFGRWYRLRKESLEDE